MKFKANAKMHSCPTIELTAAMEPIEFETYAGGTLDAEIGPFFAEVGEIPVRVAIPFLKGHRRLPLVATLGGFRFKVAPFRLNVEQASLDFKGRLGLKGLNGKLNGRVGCETDLKTDGQILGRLGLSHVDLGDDDQAQETSS